MKSHLSIPPTPSILSGLPILALSTLLGASAQAAVISNFDFTGPPWTAAKESNFATFAANAPSSDTEANSVTSTLSNNGFSGGGYASYYIRDIDGGTVGVAGAGDFEIFSTSNTPGVGMNLGGANASSATNYVSFTVAPTVGYEMTYESLSLFAGTNGMNDEVFFELRAWDGVSETSLGVKSHTATNPGFSANAPVESYSFDFSDFTSPSDTEFRLYGWGVDTPGAAPQNGGIRFDDIVLNGSSALVPEPSSAALLGLASLALLRRRR
ncbi:PEP-CTERM sorting domain-containing protein [Verrucomicrobiaceae bacterium 227]